MAQGVNKLREEDDNRGGFSPLCYLVIFLLLCLWPVPAVASPIRLDWTSQLKSGTGGKRHLSFSTPVVIEGRVYVGSSGGSFYAIDLKRGKKLWERKLEGPVLSEPLYYGGTLYVGDGKGIAYALNPEKGEIQWRAEVGEEIMATPVANDPSVYVATQNNSLVAIDRSTGAIRWMKNRSSGFSSLSIKDFSNPVMVDGKIYVGQTDGVLVAYSASDGSKLATIPVASGKGVFTDIETRPLFVDNKIIVSTMEGGLHALDRFTAAEKWSQAMGSANDIAAEGDRIYVSSKGRLLCLKIGNGEIIWQKDLREVDELSAPALGSSFVAVVSTQDKLYLLNKENSEVIFERHLSGGTYGDPVVAEGHLLVLTNGGLLYAFKIHE